MVSSPEFDILTVPGMQTGLPLVTSPTSLFHAGDGSVDQFGYCGDHQLKFSGD